MVAENRADTPLLTEFEQNFRSNRPSRRRNVWLMLPSDIHHDCYASVKLAFRVRWRQGCRWQEILCLGVIRSDCTRLCRSQVLIHLLCLKVATPPSSPPKKHNEVNHIRHNTWYCRKLIIVDGMLGKTLFWANWHCLAVPMREMSSRMKGLKRYDQSLIRTTLTNFNSIYYPAVVL